jgi:CrcB protein
VSRALLLVVLVGLGAAVGSMLRYAVDQLVQRRTGGVVLPAGTMIVNAAGSLVLGVVAGLALRGDVSATTVAVVGTGVCGGLTTFSTWTYETLRLLEDGALQEALVNVGASLALGLGLAGAGMFVATHL